MNTSKTDVEAARARAIAEALRASWRAEPNGTYR